MVMGSVRKDLKSLKVGGVTSEQLNSAGARIYLSNVPDLAEAGQLGRDIQSIRTFGPWVDPNGGAIDANAEGTSATLQPDSGTQLVVYSASALNGTGGALDCMLFLTDGVNQAMIVSQECAGGGSITALPLPFPITLTNGLYLLAQSAGNLTVSFAYHQSVRA